MAAALKDRDAGARRLRVMHALIMQGVIAVVLLGMIWFSRDQPRWIALYVATLIVPAGWSFTLWTALSREESARREGRWTKEMAASEAKRGRAMLGGLFLAWVVIAIAIVLLL